MIIPAWIPFKESSIYGFGTIRKTTPDDKTDFKYVFESERGNIYFNNVDEYHVKGIREISDLSNDDLMKL